MTCEAKVEITTPPRHQSPVHVVWNTGGLSGMTCSLALVPEEKLGVAERACAEGRFAEGEVEVPGPLEAAVVAESAHVVDLRAEVRAPPAERLGVVLSEFVDAVDPES